MTETKYVKIEVQVEAEEFWSNTLGSGWEGGYAWQKIKYNGDAEWNKMGTFDLTYLDPTDDDEEKTLTKKDIGIEDLVRAYSELATAGFHHCGSALNWQDQDLCSSDAILQQLVYGEVIYG